MAVVSDDMHGPEAVHDRWKLDWTSRIGQPLHPLRHLFGSSKGEVQVSAKYRLVRRDLEAARSWLDAADETDQKLGLMIEHVIEAVLAIEHKRGSSQGNVLAFPHWRGPGHTSKVTKS